MTREEAKEVLQEQIDLYGKEYDKEGIEALNVAISLLCKQPCEDCISREQAIAETYGFVRDTGIDEAPFEYVGTTLRNLPSVTPKQKRGRWIESTGYDDRDRWYSCSECGRNINLICGAKLADYPYCHCGAKMEVEG